MGVHLLGYEGAVASTSLTKVAGISDVYPQDSNNFILPSNRTLLAAMAGGAIIDHARISMPSLSAVAVPNIEPVCVAAQPGTNAPVCEYGPVGLPIKGQEDIEIDAANSSSTSTAVWALLWIVDNMQPLPQGPVRKIRGTSTTTLVANTWTQLTSITYDQGSLAQGQYACVGITGISAGCIAARLVFSGQFDRPGFPGLTAEGQVFPDFFRNYGLGTLGTFPSYAMPQVQLLSSSADTSETIYLHLVKVG